MMNSLFDLFGPRERSPAVIAAVQHLALESESGRGAVFTKPGVVAAILDLSGYTEDKPLHESRALEPSFGGGDFLLAMVERLLCSWKGGGHKPVDALSGLSNSIRAVELHHGSFACTQDKLVSRLIGAGISEGDARKICSRWLICDDFLLTNLSGEFDFVIGNPPYVRQERIPAALLTEYRARFSTLYDRADLYVPFFERALDLLAEGGVLGFICANRWLKNRYGKPLREKIARSFRLTYFLDMEGVDAFHSEVIAYPAITVIQRNSGIARHGARTRVAVSSALADGDLTSIVSDLRRVDIKGDSVSEMDLTDGGAPWLFNGTSDLALLRKLEREWPTLEEAGCKVGIGVATGCDRVYIRDFDSLPVEPARKLPLVMGRDLIDGEIHWHGKGVLNPFEPDGSLADLGMYPRFAAYLESHRDAISGRNVAKRNAVGWYRTIDKIHPDLVSQPKLLVPDIKGKSTFVVDEGHYYPHHNLYFILPGSWDIRALQTVMRSSVTLMMVASYCTRMAGGFLRFQAQYLRRIRLPRWQDVDAELRRELISVATMSDQESVDRPVFRLYGLSVQESGIAGQVATYAQVSLKSRRSEK